MNAMTEHSHKKIVVTWLLICCALVFAMICVGGITRLTHSGLSIVEWQPIVGTLPPLTDSQWQETFAKYRLTPEYQRVNRGMSLEGFKGIFWWEYFHRLLGRLIGMVFFVPMLYFAWKGWIARQTLPKYLGIFLLGGLQGAMGWYMVASGLVDDPRVSQYRLTAHLGLAFLIFAAILWMALDLASDGGRRSTVVRASSSLRRHAWVLLSLVFLMVITGGFVAGIRAGLAYNTFPLMNGHFFPPELFLIDPWYLNFFNNMATVQFDHRLIAWMLAIGVPWFWLRARQPDTPQAVKTASNWLLGLLTLQISLGIATLLLVVPIPLAAAHQACAVLVFTAALCVVHATR
ncbi:MAG: COX15/CtaA family protein [Burkholderiales bacterium]